MKTCQVSLLVWVAIIPVAYELNSYCDGTWCEATNMSCSEQHPYKVESSMCIPNTTVPKIPAGASRVCTPCSPPNKSGAEVSPEGLRYSLLSIDPSKFRVTVQWRIYSTVGLSSFEVRVYEVQQLSASVLFCLCLDNQTSMFEFEETYLKCTQYGSIRVQIISEPYVDGYINSNMATMQFQCPLKCSDIPSLDFMGCDHRYSDPVVGVYPLSEGESNGTHVYVSMTLPEPPPSIFYYHVMVSSQLEGVTCTNNAMTTCFTTNRTWFTLGPLNSSATYQLAVQLYVPCSNGPCTNGSTVTFKPQLPSLSPSQSTVTMAPLASQQVPGSFVDGGLKWVELSSVVLVLVIGVSVLVGVMFLCRRRRAMKLTRRETSLLTPCDSATPGVTLHTLSVTPCDGATPGVMPHDGATLSVTPCDGVTPDVTPLSPGTTVKGVIRDDGSPPLLHTEQPNRPRRHNIFVAYSFSSTPQERQVILNNLVHRMQSEHQMEVHGHDIMTQKGTTPYTVEQFCHSSVVLCVCNKSFFDEWTAGVPPPQASTAVLIRSLLAADLQKGKDITRYAVVLMKRGDAHYIPTNYLSSCRQFFVNEVEGIAEFIKNIKV